MVTRRTFMALVGTMVVSAAGLMAPSQASAANPNSLNTQILVLNNTDTHVTFRVVGDARLGPFTARVNSDPIRVRKNGKAELRIVVGGVTFRITAECSPTRLRVRTVASANIFGQTVSVSDTKQVSIN